MTKHALLRSSRSGYVLVLVICGAMISGCGGPRAKQGTAHPAVGQPLLLVELEPLTGSGAPITSQSLAGRVTVMNFWATWCPPCKDEFPKMAAMAKKFAADPKFQYLSVNTNLETGEELLDLVRKFQLEQHADHPTWTDSTNTTRRVLSEQIGWTGGIPLTLVFDSQGVIRGIWNGYQRGDEVSMEALVRELLEQ